MRHILSGLLYLSTFMISFYFFHKVEKSKAWNERRIVRGQIIARNTVLHLFVAVMVPSVIAGLRADSVGVDVETYIIPNLQKALDSDSFFELCSRIGVATEYLYALIVYIASRLSNDCGVLLFMIQLATIVPMVIAISVIREKVSLSFASLVYFFCFYNNSLNTMRQSIAVMFIFLGGVMMMKKEGKISIGSIICFATAVLAHNSSFIGIFALIFVLEISYSKMLRKLKIILYACVILLPFFITALYELINGLGILPERFNSYASIFLYKTWSKNWFVNPFSLRILSDVFFRCALVILPWWYARKSMKEVVSYRAVQTVTGIGLLFYLTILYSLNTVYGGRISLFFDCFLILLIPWKEVKEKSSYYRRIITVTLFMYWVIWVMIGGWSGSNLYEFRF